MIYSNEHYLVNITYKRGTGEYYEESKNEYCWEGYTLASCISDDIKKFRDYGCFKIYLGSSSVLFEDVLTKESKEIVWEIHPFWKF